MIDQENNPRKDARSVLDPVNPTSSGSINDQNTFVNLEQGQELDIPWAQIIFIGAAAGVALYLAQRIGIFRNPFLKKLLVSRAAQKAINTYFDRQGVEKILH